MLTQNKSTEKKNLRLSGGENLCLKLAGCNNRDSYLVAGTRVSFFADQAQNIQVPLYVSVQDINTAVKHNEIWGFYLN